jgi:uncharacterized membrane protein
MNEQERAELERLKRRQEALQMQLAGLGADIRHLTARLSAATQPAPEILPPEASQSVTQPPPKEAVEPDRYSSAVPPPLPPVIPAVAIREALAEAHTESHEQPPAFMPSSVTPPPPPQRETFEMKLGTYWLVRVGIVMLLTGLVFLGTYAYKNFIGKFGPAGKVTLLYAASATLLGFGGWLQRKREKEALRNYGQVLFAGGLAAVYFTTYAAHYVEVLRVIASPVIDALLLMAWAAVTVWIADRRKSEVLALFAVGLAYYTSAITQVGLFTLGSNLVLTAAAVFFLVRNRWTTLSFISVLATYGGFAFWRFHRGDWSLDARVAEVWHANFFLTGYWLFFTAAVFFARGKSLANAGRALFASLNNGAFFALVLLSMLHIAHGNFWKFSLGFGSVLLLAALAARQFLTDELVVKNTYVVQGLTLVTVGFIAYFTGLKLALVLAAESVVLTFLGRQQKNFLVSAGGYVTAALSAAWVLSAMTTSNSDVLLGSAISAALLLNAWWEQRHDDERDVSVVRPSSSYFVALAIGVCGIVTWHAVPEQWRAVAWMIEAVTLTALFYAFRISELPLFAQALAVAAQGYWFFEFALRQNRPHWLVPATLIGGTLALSHWWQRQKRLAFAPELRHLLQIVYGLALVGVLFFWFQPKLAPAAWLAFLNVLAIGLTIYGVVTRAWALAACAQVFLLISSVEFFQQFLDGKPAWQFALVPVATWLVLGIATTAFLSRAGDATREEVRRPLLQVSTFYRAVAFLMSLWWVFAYVPAPNQFWVFCALGLALLVLAGAMKSREVIAFSALYLAVAFATWFVKVFIDVSVVNWANALAMVCVLAAQQLTRRLPQRYKLPQRADSVAILITGLALWTFVSRWVVLTSGAHFLLTVSWAALAAALFAAGFVLRERMHRWLGLGILACAVGRVFLSDVWKLETIYRILSFMALGVVLLALGFIYNKYQEKIRQWL